MKTSTPRPLGAGGAVRYLRRHTVAIRKNELISPYVSAITRTTEKTIAWGFSDQPHRQIIQYRP